jgi:hypothetical protein
MNDIYFIRHSFNNAEAVWKHCKEQQCIAIHFNREAHEEYELYSKENQVAGFKKAFADLQKLAATGGKVVVQFESSAFQMGIVSPGTPLTFYNFPDGNPAQDNFYKTLRLARISPLFHYAQYPLLSALRPPFQTIARMSPVVANMFDHLLSGTPLDFTVGNLHPQMLELMCDEYLRTDWCPQEYRIQFALVRTGKTLPVIDMYAYTRQGQYLCMQVTHAADAYKVRSKAEKLKIYLGDIAGQKDAIGIFAAPLVHETLIKNMGLNFLSIEDVFHTLAQHRQYAHMLRELIGIKQTSK